MEQRQAKKDFRKMMKEYQLPKVLQQEEDYEQFYKEDPTSKEQEIANAKEEEDQALPS